MFKSQEANVCHPVFLQVHLKCCHIFSATFRHSKHQLLPYFSLVRIAHCTSWEVRLAGPLSNHTSTDDAAEPQLPQKQHRTSHNWARVQVTSDWREGLGREKHRLGDEKKQGKGTKWKAELQLETSCSDGTARWRQILRRTDRRLECGFHR